MGHYEDSIIMIQQQRQRQYDDPFFVQPVTASGKDTEELLLDEDKQKSTPVSATPPVD